MSDDLANDWGCDLICMGRSSGRKRKVGATIAILADDRRHRNFHSLIEKTTNNLFGLMKLTTNGSDANLYAVTSQTQENTSGCLVACGSYVSGDSGPLQSWSTSAFDIGSGPSGIISPEDQRITPFTLEHTIALPYFIEGTMCDDDRRKYENECLEHLHIMCLYNKVMKKKVTCILMEITLASNGSTVSDRALTILGHLACLHDFGIVVDEIMTGGRTKTMLSTMEKPKIFQKSVQFITMGKWLKCGMVLGSKRQQNIRNKLLSEQLPRGASTGINGNEAYTIYSEVVNNLENVDARRRTVLTKCRVKETEAWGKGLHIFILGKREGILAGTRNRLLPLITNTPITVLAPKKCPEWNKEAVNEKIVRSCRKWIISPKFGGLDEFGYIFKIIFYFVDQASDWKDSFCQTDYIIKKVLDKDCPLKKSDVTSILELISDAGLIKQVRKYKNRLRGWNLSDEVGMKSILENA